MHVLRTEINQLYMFENKLWITMVHRTQQYAFVSAKSSSWTDLSPNKQIKVFHELQKRCFSSRASQWLNESNSTFRVPDRTSTTKIGSDNQELDTPVDWLGIFRRSGRGKLTPTYPLTGHWATSRASIKAFRPLKYIPGKIFSENQGEGIHHISVQLDTEVPIDSAMSHF